MVRQVALNGAIASAAVTIIGIWILFFPHPVALTGWQAVAGVVSLLFAAMMWHTVYLDWSDWRPGRRR